MARVAAPAVTRRFVAATAFSGAGQTVQCVLCDEEVEDFQQHAARDDHVARFTVCQTLVSPQKHEAMMRQMWDHLRLDFGAVAEVNAEKVERRRKRLSSTLVYLVQRGVLIHAVPVQRLAQQQGGSSTDFTAVGVSKEFESFELLGEMEVMREVTDRCARLFPAATERELRALVAFVCRRRHLELMYDLLTFDRMLSEGGAKVPSTAAEAEATEQKRAAATSGVQLTAGQRSRVFLAVVGELHLRTGAQRPTSCAGGRAADYLVDNVLASHAQENILSELIHHVLQKVVDDATPVWAQFKQSLVAMSLSADRPRSPTLANAPSAVTDPVDGTVERLPVSLGADDEHGGATSAACNPKLLWSDVVAGGGLELTVPNPPKGAFYATLLPKLANKVKAAK